MIRSVFAADWDDHYKAFETRVWLDGVEVTDDCQTAITDEPDEAGAVLVMKRGADGRPYVDMGEVAREWKHGIVMIREKAR